MGIQAAGGLDKGLTVLEVQRSQIRAAEWGRGFDSLGIAKQRSAAYDQATVMTRTGAEAPDTAITEDPYFTGSIPGKSPPSKRGGPGELTPVLPWMGVSLVNLIVPLYFGYLVTRGSGRVGMVLGILFVFSLGCGLCFVSRKAILAAVYGGWIVAASQFSPLLQIFSGSIGIRADSALGLTTTHRPDDVYVDTALGGLVATVVTGAILLIVATILGLVIQWIFLALTRRKRAASKADALETFS